MTDLVLLTEVAEALAEHGRLRCVPAVERHAGEIVITLTLKRDDGDAPEAFQILELAERMQYLRDVCQLRHLAQKYAIPPEALERALAWKPEPE